EEQQEQPDLDLDDKEVRHMRLWPSSPRTSPTKRYPRPCTLAIHRGSAASSPSTRRSSATRESTARVPTASSSPHSTSSSRERSMSSSFRTSGYSRRVKALGGCTPSRWRSRPRLAPRSPRRPKRDTSTRAGGRGGPPGGGRRGTARSRCTVYLGSKGYL